MYLHRAIIKLLLYSMHNKGISIFSTDANGRSFIQGTVSEFQMLRVIASSSSQLGRGVSHLSAMTEELDCGLEVSEFKHQSL